MVTDFERDYLWGPTPADRRAAIQSSASARRPHALLERDRRRIELHELPPVSMPGTPSIYYGDEIGMGDNIHLGDRDGVRTPMHVDTRPQRRLLARRSGALVFRR